MQYYREYVETEGPFGPYVAEIRLCHDFPEIAPNGGNQVAVFDDRVQMSDDWSHEDMPTDTFRALVC